MDTQINFYGSYNLSILDILVKFLEKSLSNDFLSVVISQDLELLVNIDEYLWQYDAKSFLPHININSSFIKYNPIILSSSSDEKRLNEMFFQNNKIFQESPPIALFLVDNFIPEIISLENISRVCYLYNLFDSTQNHLQDTIKYYQKLNKDSDSSSLTFNYYAQNKQLKWEKQVEL